MLDLVAAFIALTTLLTYVNYRFIRLPPTIGVMATALVFSLIVQGLSELGYPILEVEMQGTFTSPSSCSTVLNVRSRVDPPAP